MEKQKTTQKSIVEKEQIAYMNFRQVKTLSRRKTLDENQEYSIMPVFAK